VNEVLLLDRLPKGGVAESGVVLFMQQANRAMSGISDRTGTGRCFIDTQVTSLRFAVIGAGRLGASLALALRDHGMHLVGFSALTPAGRERSESWLGAKASSTISDLVSRAPDLYLVAVPDSALPEVAAALGTLLVGSAGPLVAHTSGATSVRVLDPCSAAGATTLVFHPLQTFADPMVGRSRFAGSAVAITPYSGGQESLGAVVGFALAQLVDARPFFLLDDKRALYHAAATMACNYLVTLEHNAREAFVLSGLPSEEALSLFLPLVKATLENIEDQGTVKALTGPLSRGDIGTVRSHLAALFEDAPELLPLYNALGLATLPLVQARKEIDATSIAGLEGLLTAPTRDFLTDNEPEASLT
jgi:predicted short-subunit dehydrogenase-like oxidoreductase (DUF2520 family)